MPNCKICGRKLTNPKHFAAGVGPVCAKKRIPDDPREKFSKVYFMSKPTTSAADRRTWLVRIPGEPSYLVRIYVDDEGRSATCDCPTGKHKTKCRHVELVAAADSKRFNLEQK